jgi:hypothetical protein
MKKDPLQIANSDIEERERLASASRGRKRSQIYLYYRKDPFPAILSTIFTILGLLMGSRLLPFFSLDFPGTRLHGVLYGYLFGLACFVVSHVLWRWMGRDLSGKILPPALRLAEIGRSLASDFPWLLSGPGLLAAGALCFYATHVTDLSIFSFLAIPLAGFGFIRVILLQAYLMAFIEVIIRAMAGTD